MVVVICSGYCVCSVFFVSFVIVVVVHVADDIVVAVVAVVIIVGSRKLTSKFVQNRTSNSLRERENVLLMPDRNKVKN